MVHSGITTTSLRGRIQQAGSFCICLACFFTPLSTSLLSIFSILAVTAWIISGGFLELPRIVQRHPGSLVALLLFALMCAAISYSPAEPELALNTLKKYREFLLIPIVIGLLGNSEGDYRTAVDALIAGCIVLLVISYGMAGGLIPEERYGHSLVFHITHSFFMAILAYCSLLRFFQYKQYRYLWGPVFLLTTFNIFYIAPGRTGMLVYSCLIVLFFWQCLSFSKRLIAFLLLVTTIVVFYTTSDNFSGRVNEVVDEVKNYEPNRSRTSIGQRFDWWASSAELIREKPLLGHGTGSFSIVHRNVSKNSSIKETDNPHNEFLFLAVQFGLTALALFFLLLFLQLLEGRRMEKYDRFLLQATIVAILSGSVMNSLLFDSQQGHFYLFITAALMASTERQSGLLQLK